MKTIKSFDQFKNEGAGFGTAHSNVPEGIPNHVDPQDGLMKRAKQLLGYDVKDLEVAAEELDKLTDVNAVLKKLNQEDSKEAKKLAKALLATVHERFNPPVVDNSRLDNLTDMDDDCSEDTYETYLNNSYGSTELEENEEFEYLRSKADRDGNEWMYKDGGYGTLLRTYDKESFDEGYENYCKD